ncbi:hypothetical protein [Streptomyces sp. NRRL F-5123]|uniref:hypothetical protein n=1 Tax=Streptomyces sp. NRRL F-5123 TaxID=1463856 RepID=UPI0004E20FDA|nr:hypothetical protein [Streptomyces sp. NRRL F-5123]
MRPEPPPLPALTRSEGELVDCYLEVVDLLGRVNPSRGTDTYGALRAAQALVGRALALREALTVMHLRGETELHHATLGRALRVLDGERRSSLAVVAPEPEPPSR